MGAQVSKVDASEVQDCYLSAVTNNLATCDAGSTGSTTVIMESAGDIDIEGGINITNVSTQDANCMFSADVQEGITGDLAAQLDATASNSKGLLDMMPSFQQSIVDASVSQDITETATTNNMQTCGGNAGDVYVMLESAGGITVTGAGDNGAVVVDNTSNNYLSCVFDSSTTENLSADLSAQLTASASNAKKELGATGNIFSLLILGSVFVVLIMAAFAVFRSADKGGTGIGRGRGGRRAGMARTAAGIVAENPELLAAL